MILENSHLRKLKVIENRLKTKFLHGPDDHNFSRFHETYQLMLFYRSQKYAGYEGCRRESQQSESDSWNNEDDDMFHRTSILPRSNQKCSSFLIVIGQLLRITTLRSTLHVVVYMYIS